MKTSQVFKERKECQVERRGGKRQERGAKMVGLQTSPARN